jgi:hypothetical protein
MYNNELLARVAAAWNITLTEPSESWDMQPPINERYTEYVLTDAERAELRTALGAHVRVQKLEAAIAFWKIARYQEICPDPCDIDARRQVQEALDLAETTLYGLIGR